MDETTDILETSTDPSTEVEPSEELESEPTDEPLGEDEPDSSEEDESDDSEEGDEEDPDPSDEFRAALEAERAKWQSSSQSEEDEGDDSEEGDYGDYGDVPAPSGLREEWEREKAAIQETWDGMEGVENERRLVAFIDKIIPSLEALSHAQQQAETRAIQTEAAFYVQEAQAAAAEVKNRYGLDIEFADMLGFAQSGGLQAYAALNGVDITDLKGKVDRNVFMNVFELKNRSLLEKVKAKPAQKKVHRPLTTGGGAREASAPADERESFRQARREAASRKG